MAGHMCLATQKGIWFMCSCLCRTNKIDDLAMGFSVLSKLI